METIAQNLQKLIDSKAAIKQSLINKGQEVGDVFSEYPDAVYNIPQSGGSSDYKLAIEGLLTGSVTISEGVTIIRPYRFSDCIISSVKLPESLTTIQDHAFSLCYSLNTINFPESLTTIENNAFESCESLTSVTLGSKITSIAYSAFENCNKLEITIKATTPPTLSLSGRGVFTGVLSIYVPDESVETYKTASGWTRWASIIKPISEKGN